MMFFFATMPGMVKHFEMMHVQYRQGVMDQETGMPGASIVGFRANPGAERGIEAAERI